MKEKPKKKKQKNLVQDNGRVWIEEGDKRELAEKNEKKMKEKAQKKQKNLVHDDGRVWGEEGVKHELAEENAIRHELDASLVAHHLTNNNRKRTHSNASWWVLSLTT